MDEYFTILRNNRVAKSNEKFNQDVCTWIESALKPQWDSIEFSCSYINSHQTLFDIKAINLKGQLVHYRLNIFECLSTLVSTTFDWDDVRDAWLNQPIKISSIDEHGIYEELLKVELVGMAVLYLKYQAQNIEQGDAHALNYSKKYSFCL